MMSLKSGVKVERRKVPEYFNEYYYSALSLYNRYLRFGLPYAPDGWADHPNYIIELIELFVHAENMMAPKQTSAQVGKELFKK